MFELVLLIVVIFYFVFSSIVLVGSSKKYLKNNKYEKVSVVVAARNEEDNILNCIKSLSDQTMESESYEVIIVDDFSTDKTAELVNSFIETHKNFKLVQPTENITEKPGKANALGNGINIASNEIILTTDADCIVNPNWVETMAKYFTDENVAFVGGFTNQTADNAFHEMQSLDFMILLTAASGTINLGKPISCIGNNMGFRKSVYNEVGGFAKIPFSVTEDFALITNIDNLKKYKIIYPKDQNTLVTSKPLNTIKEIFWQKKRWSVGGLKSDFIGFIVIGVSVITNFMMLVSLLFMDKNILPIIFLKILVDFLLLLGTHKPLKTKFSILGFLYFEIYYTLYVSFMPIVVTFSHKVKWKEREY